MVIWLLARWRLVAGVAAVAGIFAVSWHLRGRLAEAAADRAALVEARQELEDTARRLDDAEAIGKADAAAAVRFATEAVEAQIRAEQLRAAVFAAVRAGELVTDREDPNDASRRAPVLSPLWRLCWNAATSGDPAAAAACEAGSGDAAGGSAVPAAGLVRSGVAP